MLQRQMQMRHEARLVGDEIEQMRIDLDAVDGGQPQAANLRHLLQKRFCQLPQRRAARQVAAIAGGIDTGQHHLAVTGLHQPTRLIDHRPHRHRAGIAAAIGDDAEGAAMVAARLHL